MLETVLKHCTKYEPLERPSMDAVVSRLEMIIEEADAVPSTGASTRRPPTAAPKSMRREGESSVSNPWKLGSKVATSLDTFASRLEDEESGQKLLELAKEVREVLGPDVTSNMSGVYNHARLYRMLCFNSMDVCDTLSMVIVNSNAREEFGVDAKRQRIVTENLGFSTLPDQDKWRKYQPHNLFLGMSKDGRLVTYYSLGTAADFVGESECGGV